MNDETIFTRESIRQRYLSHMYSQPSRRYMRKVARMRREREAHKRFWRSKLGNSSKDGQLDRYYGNKIDKVPDNI